MFCLAGTVWIVHGTGVIAGARMRRHGRYAIDRIALMPIGLALLGWAYSVPRSGVPPTG
jgi:hypothetical protein